MRQPRLGDENDHHDIFFRLTFRLVDKNTNYTNYNQGLLSHGNLRVPNMPPPPPKK